MLESPHETSRHRATRLLFAPEPCGRWHARVIAYVVREHDRGRAVSEILGDPFLLEHASSSAIAQLLQDPTLIRRLAEDCLLPLARVQRYDA